MEITRLVRRAKRKDADAFTELMESQMQNMYKVARSILSRDEDVAVSMKFHQKKMEVRIR